MKLVTYKAGSKHAIGILDDNVIIDLSSTSNLPQTMQALIEAGDNVMSQVIHTASLREKTIPLQQAQLLAPIPEPKRNIICVGKNYHAHLKEVSSLSTSPTEKNGSVPDQPIFFSKATTSVIGPGDTIPAHLDTTESVDYEGELAIVIGKEGRGIPKVNAIQHIFGYTILNDVTSRRLQKKHQQWFLGKSLDGFCPIGPAILTADAVPDVTQLNITTHVNDELRQQGKLSDLIFDIPTLIHTLSQYMTLLPGDIIATGTPAGVGMGFNPPKFLKAGDVVTISINGIGELKNPVS